eukprot:1158409-Pelagomonas_calceolata.AAC.8
MHAPPTSNQLALHHLNHLASTSITLPLITLITSTTLPLTSINLHLIQLDHPALDRLDHPAFDHIDHLALDHIDHPALDSIRPPCHP